MKQFDKYHFFYGGPFSQWAACTFTLDGDDYNCAEQYMMAQKAIKFEDYEALNTIMSTDNPAKQKATGRKVRGFDQQLWEKDAKLVVYRANFAKFMQSTDLMLDLLTTRGHLLVEASPTDRIWGIGLSENNPDIHDPAKWQGTNWLGEIITQVREDMANYD